MQNAAMWSISFRLPHHAGTAGCESSSLRRSLNDWESVQYFFNINLQEDEQWCSRVHLVRVRIQVRVLEKRLESTAAWLEFSTAAWVHQVEQRQIHKTQMKHAILIQLMRKRKNDSLFTYFQVIMSTSPVGSSPSHEDQCPSPSPSPEK